MSVYSEFVSASALIVHCNAFSWLLDIVDPQPAAPPDGLAPSLSAEDAGARRVGGGRGAPCFPAPQPPEGGPTPPVTRGGVPNFGKDRRPARSWALQT